MGFPHVANPTVPREGVEGEDPGRYLPTYILVHRHLTGQTVIGLPSIAREEEVGPRMTRIDETIRRWPWQALHTSKNGMTSSLGDTYLGTHLCMNGRKHRMGAIGRPRLRVSTPPCHGRKSGSISTFYLTGLLTAAHVSTHLDGY